MRFEFLTPDAVYRYANCGFVLLHLVLSVVFFLGYRGKPVGSVTRSLCIPLCLFFVSGLFTHAVNVFEPGVAEEVQAMAFVLRLIVSMMATLPFLPAAVRGLKRLPTKEEYQKAIEERDAAIKRMQLEAEARIAFQTQLENRNRNLNQLANDQREQIERLKHQNVSDAEYMEMRQRLHAIRNA